MDFRSRVLLATLALMPLAAQVPAVAKGPSYPAGEVRVGTCDGGQLEHELAKLGVQPYRSVAAEREAEALAVQRAQEMARQEAMRAAEEKRKLALAEQEAQRQREYERAALVWRDASTKMIAIVEEATQAARTRAQWVADHPDDPTALQHGGPAARAAADSAIAMAVGIVAEERRRAWYTTSQDGALLEERQRNGELINQARAEIKELDPELAQAIDAAWAQAGERVERERAMAEEAEREAARQQAMEEAERAYHSAEAAVMAPAESSSRRSREEEAMRAAAEAAARAGAEAARKAAQSAGAAEAARAIPAASQQPEPPLEQPRQPHNPSSGLEWGAEVFLSNDDSMSLASAQRLLWALQKGAAFAVSEVRPHELLNYFTFDTVMPGTGKMFDVVASAEQEGDILSVALAVQGAVPDRQPLDLTVLLDVSGSMREAGRIDYTKRGLRVAADKLQAGDRVDLVTFESSACTLLENYVEGRDDPRFLDAAIASLTPGGGTNLEAGLTMAYGVARKHRDAKGRNRRMMLFTDAGLNVGIVNRDEVSEIGRAYEEDGIRLTAIGVGHDVRDDVLNKLSEKGKGAYVFLGSEAVVDRIFDDNFTSLTTTIAHNVQFSLQLPESLAMERFYGEEASTVAADVQPIHYYAGTSQLFLQDLRVSEMKPSDPVVLSIAYEDAVTGAEQKRTFKTTVGAMLKADKHNVRKAQALMAWTDVLSTSAMGGEGCGELLERFDLAAGRVRDPELDHVAELSGALCGGRRMGSR